MQRTLILIGIFGLPLILQGCTTFNPPQPMANVKNTLDARFTYVSNHDRYGRDFAWQPGETGERAFSGNCVNYADAAVFQLKKQGIVAREWFVKTERGEFHMVVCADGWCIDNRRREPFVQNDYAYRWIVDATLTAH